MIDLFQRALEFARGEPPEDKLRKIEAGLGRYGLTDPVDGIFDHAMEGLLPHEKVLPADR